MSDFLSRLADRSQGQAHLARPRQRSRFELEPPLPLSEPLPEDLLSEAEVTVPARIDPRAEPNADEPPVPARSTRAAADRARRQEIAAPPEHLPVPKVVRRPETSATAPAAVPEVLVREVIAPGRRSTPRRAVPVREGKPLREKEPGEGPGSAAAVAEKVRREALPTPPETPAGRAEAARVRPQPSPSALLRAPATDALVARTEPRRAPRLQDAAAEPGSGPPAPLTAGPPLAVAPRRPLDRGGRPGPSAAESEPVIRVKIGRIDVRAVTPPAPPARERRPRGPKLTLGDYLKARNERRR